VAKIVNAWSKSLMLCGAHGSRKHKTGKLPRDDNNAIQLNAPFVSTTEVMTWRANRHRLCRKFFWCPNSGLLNTTPKHPPRTKIPKIVGNSLGEEPLSGARQG
jgi:hypothetical protein